MKTYPTSNAEAQMTHAAWDAAPPMDYDELEEFEVADRLKQERQKEQEAEDGE
jgi:hypothetical protein